MPENPTSGTVTVFDTSVGSNVTYSCNKGYRIYGQVVRQCQSNGQWSGSVPTCEGMIDMYLRDAIYILAKCHRQSAVVTLIVPLAHYSKSILL